MGNEATTADNAAATDELAALVSRLSDDDLGRDLGEGWTVATALGHLAFWDRQQRLNLAVWLRDGELPAMGDWVNEALTPLLRAVDPRAAAALAVAAARELDRAVEGVGAEGRERITAEGHGYVIRRARHRREHGEQIAAAIG